MRPRTLTCSTPDLNTYIGKILDTTPYVIFRISILINHKLQKVSILLNNIPVYVVWVQDKRQMDRCIIHRRKVRDSLGSKGGWGGLYVEKINKT